MTLDEIIAELRERADRKVVAGMYRVGINPRGTLGVQIPELQKLARRVGKDHMLALDLWATGLHEARILAAMVDDPAELTEEQMDRWAQAFDSWDVCDQVCKYLFGRSPLAYAKAKEWAGHGGQFVKRASFALIADLAVNDKNAADEPFLEFLELAEREAADERNYVKKSVSWAVRQIGKRNAALNKAALAGAARIKAQGSAPARWIAADAMRELSSAAVQGRFKKAAAQKKAKKGEDAGQTAAAGIEPRAEEGATVPSEPGAGADQGAGALPGVAEEEGELEGTAAAEAAEASERPAAPRRRRGSRGGRGRGSKAVSDEPAGAEPGAAAEAPGDDAAGGTPESAPPPRRRPRGSRTKGAAKEPAEEPSS